MSDRDARLLEGLRATLQELENGEGVSRDDAALIALRSILLRRIADLEAEKPSDANREQAAD